MRLDPATFRNVASPGFLHETTLLSARDPRLASKADFVTPAVEYSPRPSLCSEYSMYDEPDSLSNAPAWSAADLVAAEGLLHTRWTLRLLAELLRRPLRFTELARSLQGISSSVLTARLDELERHGVVRRGLAGSGGSAVHYELTPRGHEGIWVVAAAVEWAQLLSRDEAR